MFIKLKSKRSGFMLYESVLSLMIAIMTLGILQQSLQILRTIEKTSFRDQLRWHITQEKLQAMIGPSHIKSVSDNQIAFDEKATDRRKIIKPYDFKTLLLTDAQTDGYEPIMTRLNQIKIEKIQNLVIITTENEAGQTSQICLVNYD